MNPGLRLPRAALRGGVLFAAALFVVLVLIYTLSAILSGADFPSLSAFLIFLLLGLVASIAIGLVVAHQTQGRFAKAFPEVLGKITEHAGPAHPLVQTPVDETRGEPSSQVSAAFDEATRDRIKLLSRHKGQLERLFDVMPGYITVQNRDFRITRSNLRFKQDFGDPDERACYEIYKDRTSPCENCSVAKTFQDGEIHSNEEEVITRSGERLSLIVYSAPIRDENGEILAVMEMSTNISEIKRLQQELHTQRQQYEQLFGIVPCYISIQDRQLRILQTNETFRSAFGVGEGDRCHRVYKGAEVPCPDCPVEKTFQDGQVHFGEELVITVDGKEANVIVYTAPIRDEAGNITSVMEMSTDITEVKKLQRELILMGQSVATMAHSIKNILMGLEGGVFVVTTAMEDRNDALLTEGWDMVNRNVAKVSHIVKGLLYCSKQRTPQFKREDPNRIAQEAYDLFKQKAGEDEVHLELELGAGVPEADLDPDSIHDLLSNLLSNALDACRYDLAKSEHRARLRTYAKPPDGMVYEVSDNGPGIPADVRARLFDGFYSTKGNKGTGLGLQIARKVVQEHLGQISVASEPGQGAIFTVSLPCRRPPS